MSFEGYDNMGYSISNDVVKDMAKSYDRTINNLENLKYECNAFICFWNWLCEILNMSRYKKQSFDDYVKENYDSEIFEIYMELKYDSFK